MSEIDGLLAAYEDILKLPWKSNLSGSEKVWFVIYDPANERRIRLRISDFELSTIQAGYKWDHLDITGFFPEWMAKLEYREAYFENPEDMDPMLEDFSEFITTEIGNKLGEADEKTILAINGIASLFGLTHTSKVVENASSRIKGRLLILFPGSFDGSVYRLLDARDGWNYLAVPITGR